ncbi:MAG: phosphoribosylformylglycinamidine synthase II, partial [Dehalococcoidia bacterium]
SGVPVQGRLDAALFGEAQSRIVVSCPPEARADLEALAREHDVPLTYLGAVGGDRLRLASSVDAPLADLSRAYEEGLPRALGG